MATAVEPAPAFAFEEAQSVLLENVPYRLYVELADAAGDAHVRFTYDRGALEIMTVSPEHEAYKVAFFLIIQILTEELEVPVKALGSSTCRREDLARGLEPDECFYLENWKRIAGKKRLDLTVDPPPDLAIEVDVMSRSLNRQGVYASLGVPEIWRFDKHKLVAYRLRPDGEYAACDRSPSFPAIPLDGLARFANQFRDTEDTVWKRTFRAWVREQIAAR